MIKLDELRAELSRWPKDWTPALDGDREWKGYWRGTNQDGDEDRVSADTIEDYRNELARFVADLVNVAPALLDIAEAARAWRDQRNQNLLDAIGPRGLEDESVEARRARVRHTYELGKAVVKALARLEALP